MNLFIPSTDPIRPAASPQSLEQREQAAVAREQSLAGAIEALAQLHREVLEQRSALEANADPAAAGLPLPSVPDPAAEVLVKALRVVREDALRQRAEAADIVERRVSALRDAVEAARRQLRSLAEAAAAQRARARAEQRRAAPAPDPLAPESTATGAAPRAPENRRASRRVELVTAVDLHTESNFFSGFSGDLSMGGLFIATLERAEVGSPIGLKFTLPGGAQIEAEGAVRWVRELSPVQPELMPGVGVAFTSIHPASLEAIARFIAEREPMFLPD